MNANKSNYLAVPVLAAIFSFVIFFAWHKESFAFSNRNINSNSSTKIIVAEILVNPSNPSQQLFFYRGKIKKISSGSLILNKKNPTILIVPSTVCKAPIKSGKIMDNSNGVQHTQRVLTVPCSSLSGGETVFVRAVKNSAGQPTAVLIEEVFY